MGEEDGKIIKRVTTFRFDSNNEMIRAFAEFGINIRRERHQVRYQWRQYRDLNWDSRCILVALGQQYETIMDYYMTNGWECKQDIIERFGLPINTAFDW